jgi:hypothetical protein
MPLSQHQVNRLLKGVYRGKYSRKILPVGYYLDTAGEMVKAIKKGFGIRNLTSTSKYFGVISELSDNVHMFSAAKTYHMVRELEEVRKLTTNYREYKEYADQVYDKYTTTWQTAEVDTALATAQQIKKWEQIQNEIDVLPYLRYSAVAGACAICGPMDGIVQPADSAFVAKYYPPNHYSCLCIMIQEPGDTRLTSSKRVDQVDTEASAKMSPVFLTNAGQTRQIFNGDHPYFEVARGDKRLAKRNFDLPIPDPNAK